MTYPILKKEAPLTSDDLEQIEVTDLGRYNKKQLLLMLLPFLN